MISDLAFLFLSSQFLLLFCFINLLPNEDSVSAFLRNEYSASGDTPCRSKSRSTLKSKQDVSSCLHITTTTTYVSKSSSMDTFTDAANREKSWLVEGFMLYHRV